MYVFMCGSECVCIHIIYIAGGELGTLNGEHYSMANCAQSLACVRVCFCVHVSVCMCGCACMCLHTMYIAGGELGTLNGVCGGV